ncbi:hypothetical protein [Solirubrobacter soli]|uniref:hypothetical protein n=1 Tax=Solirubrobacter soli TaxID=363832 RepID=UPI0003F99829|nr:hypothetical protein [Solirubrobacter soli]
MPKATTLEPPARTTRAARRTAETKTENQPVTREQPTRQVAVTVVADVDASALDRLRELLRSMAGDPAGNEVVPLGRLPGTHFARFVLLEATTDLDGGAIEPHLVYMADIDAPLDEDAPDERHLRELVESAPGLDRILGACAGYPRRRRSREARLEFLLAHRVTPAAAYVNTVGRSVWQILAEESLHRALETFLDEHGDWRHRVPEDVRAAIQDYVAITPELAWARRRRPSPGFTQRALHYAGLAKLPLTAAALSPVLVPAVPVFALLLRLQELGDKAPHIRPTAAHVRELAKAEDRTAVNQFSAIGAVKTGLVRRATIGVVTRGLDFGAKTIFDHANLAGVKTIHFARWVTLDEGRRMIFTSNYDGSVESYNDDFIDKVWWGLNAVFSNGYGWPKTSWLFFGGAKREQEFKDYLRCHQIPTQVWFAAYPDLTALNIETNAEIRAGLYGEMTREQAREWLLRI